MLAGAGRLGQLLLTVLGVVLLTFLLIHLVPGDPAVSILGTRATPENVAALRSSLHLDEPFLQQLWSYVSSVATGDLGESLVQKGRPVSEIVLDSLQVTLQLTLVTVLVAGFVGTAAGVTAAMTERRGVDVAMRSTAMVMLATPPFLFGFLLLLVVALGMGLAPVGGWGTGFFDNLQYLWLPSLALAAFLMPIVFRSVRQATRETLDEDFVEAAVVRGLRQRTIVLRHVLPNSLLPVITVLGVNVGGLIGGAVVIETVFNLPGIGLTLVEAVETRDYPVVQGVAIFTAIVVVLITALTEVAASALDPRMRKARA